MHDIRDYGTQAFEVASEMHTLIRAWENVPAIVREFVNRNRSTARRVMHYTI